MDWYHLLMNPASAVFVVGAIAIVVTGVVKIVMGYLRHRERVEMIRNGMRPDDNFTDPDCDS